MRNIKLTYQRGSIETCIATLTTEIDGKETSTTIDFSGNNIAGALYGAISIVNALQEMNGEPPLGYVEIPKPKRKRK